MKRSEQVTMETESDASSEIAVRRAASFAVSTEATLGTLPVMNFPASSFGTCPARKTRFPVRTART